ncbi:MAG TPA: chitinase, partial [Firmicutes bacterium]|nr:chitinase [Bacillota bacterium]
MKLVRRKSIAVPVFVALATLASTQLTMNAQMETSLEQEVSPITYTSTQKRNVMYYGDWSIWGGQGNFYPKDIPADQLTHLNFAFLDFDAQGNLIFTDKDAAVGAPVGQEGVQWDAANAGILNALQELRAENPNLRLGVSIGGWSKSADFPLVAANDEARETFVENVMKFIEYTNMDFVDIDWEFAGEVRQPDLVDNKNDEGNPYASEADKELYIQLLEDLREGVDELGAKLGKTIELSVALPAPKDKVDAGIDVDRLFELVDFANIMTYDMRGAWDDVSGHQTALYPNENDPMQGRNLSISESVEYLIEQGAEPEKIVVGAAYYTRGWNEVEAGSNPALPGLFGEASLSTKDADQTPSYGAINEAPLTSGDGGRMSGVWSYRNLDTLKSKYPGLTEYWDDESKAPYLYDLSTGMFFTYDNSRSIEEKATYVNENNLGGIIGWMQSQDASTTSSKRDELTTVTKEALFGSDALPQYEIVHSDLDVTVTIEAYEEAWGSNPKGYIITVKNNEKVEETDEVLKAVERAGETIKSPKLYIKSDEALTSGEYTAGVVTYENGYTVVDFSNVWEGKTIEQGGTYTFKLKGDAQIESIHLTQRMSTSGPEMYSQLIYGTESEETEKPNTAPILLGLSNKTITLGETFDPRADVSASDYEDGDLTASIMIEG